MVIYTGVDIKFSEGTFLQSFRCYKEEGGRIEKKADPTCGNNMCFSHYFSDMAESFRIK